LIVTLTAGLAGASPAQDVARLIAEGAAVQRGDPAQGLRLFEQVLAIDSMNYDANWRGALALIDLAKQTPDSVKSPERDSLCARAERWARRAVEARPAGADGHYILARAIGSAALTRSPKERVKLAATIRAEALRAIELDPGNDGAYHVLGRWHAEIMRLSGFTRFFARTWLGARIVSEASWDAAIANLERAVALKPDAIYHRLDLAEVYIDREQYDAARAQLEAIEHLPVYDAMDPAYKATARGLLRKIAPRRDRT